MGRTGEPTAAAPDARDDRTRHAGRVTLAALELPVPYPAAGRLLVASPALVEPTFRRTVLLLLDHDEDGTLGLVVNRPSAVAVGAVLPAWDGRTLEPAVLYSGGPVAEDSALGLGLLPGPADGPEPEGFRRIVGQWGLVDLDSDPLVTMELTALRLFAGYAGWGPGQLDDELAEGSWYVVDGGADDVFAPDPGRVWSRVLRRQPNDLRLLSNPVDDPDLN